MGRNKKVKIAGSIILLLTIFISALPLYAKTKMSQSEALPKTPIIHTGFTESGSSLLDEVVISEKSNCAIISIKFNYPIQYISHFPDKDSNELRIKINILGIKPQDKESFFRRESILAPPNYYAKLEAINYEGDVEGGPFLTVYFFRKISFKVKKSTRNNTIFILVGEGAKKNDCSSDSSNSGKTK